MSNRRLKPQNQFDNAITVARRRFDANKKDQKEVRLGGNSGIYVYPIKHYLSAYLKATVKKIYTSFFIGHYYSEELETNPDFDLRKSEYPVDYQDLLNIGRGFRHLTPAQKIELYESTNKENPLTVERINNLLSKKARKAKLLSSIAKEQLSIAKEEQPKKESPTGTPTSPKEARKREIFKRLREIEREDLLEELEELERQ